MAWHPTWNEDGNDRGGRFRHVNARESFRRPGTRGLWAIILLNIFVFVALSSRDPDAPINQYGPTTVQSVLFEGQLWRLVTSQFMHGGTSHIFWNMFILWMFGRVVEMQIGTKRFVWLYLLAGVAGGLGNCLFDWTMHGLYNDPGWLTVGCIGASGGVMAITIAFALMNPKAPILLFFILPIPAIWLAVGYFVLETWPLLAMLQTGRSTGNVAHAAHLGGMLWALGWAILAGYVRTPWAQRLQRGGDRLKRRFTPSPGPRSSAPRRHPVMGGPNNGAASRPKSKDEVRLDGILRKIHEQGLMSLSESERKFLRDMSEKKRDDIHFDDNHRRQ
jgi:rhomboid family protein